MHGDKRKSRITKNRGGREQISSNAINLACIVEGEAKIVGSALYYSSGTKYKAADENPRVS